MRLQAGKTAKSGQEQNKTGSEPRVWSLRPVSISSFQEKNLRQRNVELMVAGHRSGRSRAEVPALVRSQNMPQTIMQHIREAFTKAWLGGFKDRTIIVNRAK